jgi:leader peptidase (prepilin peptidase)/N-methyltransferase
VDPETLASVAVFLFGLFWLAIGGAIGSFLNVVIYRLPRGLNLAKPPSSCPACGHRIRWHDNVPVVGWLSLRGRCRACRYPIAPRYPLVEATVALIFVILAFAELFTGGKNLPFRRPEPGGLWMMGQWSTELHLLTFLHCALFTSLVALALIDQDGMPTPVGVVAVPLGLLVVAAIFYRDITPGNILLGLLAGAACGFVLGFLYEPARRSRVPAATAGLALVGAFLGWQGALVALTGGVVVLTVLLLAAGRSAFRVRLSPLTPAGLAAFGFVLAWKPLASCLSGPVLALVLAGLAVLIVPPFFLRRS